MIYLSVFSERIRAFLSKILDSESWNYLAFWKRDFIFIHFFEIFSLRFICMLMWLSISYVLYLKKDVVFRNKLSKNTCIWKKRIIVLLSLKEISKQKALENINWFI